MTLQARLTMILLVLVEAASVVQAAEVEIYHTDPGVYMLPWAVPEILRTWAGPVISGIPDEHGPFVLWERTVQLTVPMPPDSHLPRSESEWIKYEDQLYRELATRFDAGLQQGFTVFEVRTRQNVSFAGYFESPWLHAFAGRLVAQFVETHSRQESAQRFTRTFASALDRAKSGLAAKHSVEITGIAGSNAGHSVTGVMASHYASPWDRVVLVDARAYLWNVIGAYRRLDGRLSIINTKADAPSLITMVANHGSARALQEILSKLRVFYVDTGSFFPSKGHLATLGTRTRVLSASEVRSGRPPRNLSVEAGWQVVRESIAEQSLSATRPPQTRPSAFDAPDPGGVLFETGNTYTLDEHGNLSLLLESLEIGRTSEPHWEFYASGDRLRAVPLPTSLPASSAQEIQAIAHHGEIFSIENGDEVVILREGASDGSREGTVECMLGTVLERTSMASRVIATSVWTVGYRLEDDFP